MTMDGSTCMCWANMNCSETSTLQDFATSEGASEPLGHLTEGYLEAGWRRTLIVRKAVAWGYNVLVTDVDLVWFQHPYLYLDRFPEVQPQACCSMAAEYRWQGDHTDRTWTPKLHLMCQALGCTLAHMADSGLWRTQEGSSKLSSSLACAAAAVPL